MIQIGEATYRTITNLASPPQPGEQKLFESLLALPSRWIPSKAVSTSIPSDCHGNTERFVQGNSEFEAVHGWADLGEHFILHSVVRWLNAPAGSGDLMCLTPGEIDWLVFRPDPALRLIERWGFERDGMRMPPVVRRDPNRTREEAQQVLQDLQAGTCKGWPSRIAGDPRGAEPDRVWESIAESERAARPHSASVSADYGHDAHGGSAQGDNAPVPHH